MTNNNGMWRSEVMAGNIITYAAVSDDVCVGAVSFAPTLAEDGEWDERFLGKDVAYLKQAGFVLIKPDSENSDVH